MKKESGKAIEIKDIAKYRFPGNLCYSPDGKYLAFHVKRSDPDHNCYHSDVFLYQSGSSSPARQTTFTLDARVIGWKNDTELILSRQPLDGGDHLPETSLWLLDVTGGEARPWLTLPFIMQTFKKVTDDLYAAVGIIDRNDPDLYKADAETRRKKAEEERKEKDIAIVDEVPYWANGAGYTNGLRRALFSVGLPPVTDPVTGGPAMAMPKIKRLTAPTFQTGALFVDGTDVYYAGHRFEHLYRLHDRIYCWHSVNGKTETLYRETDRSVSDIFVLKGRLFAFASDMKTYGFTETPKVYECRNGRLDLVYQPFLARGSSVATDTITESGETSAVQNDHYLTIITDADHDAIYRFDGENPPEKIWETRGLVSCFAASDKKIALCCQSWKEVFEVYEAEADGSGMRKCTDLNGDALEGRYIAEPQPVLFTSEGWDLKGWVLLPKDFDPEKKYPAALLLHGGPRGVFGETFSHEMQVLAGQGYFVLYTNVRGSDGRGDEFADIRGRYGEIDFRNFMDFTDSVLEKYPNIDRGRLCVSGGSYGGFMVNWIITHTRRFCCAVSQRGIASWISHSLMSDIGPFFSPNENGAENALDFEPLWDHSPLKYVRGVRTPTLFIHSDQDLRCPLPESMQMMQALALQKVETRLVIFRGENHAFPWAGSPKSRMRRLQETLDWFCKFSF